MARLLAPRCSLLAAARCRTPAGKFNRHTDTWDAVQQQGYFSLEAFIHMLSQVGGPCSLPLALLRAATVWAQLALEAFVLIAQPGGFAPLPGCLS